MERQLFRLLYKITDFVFDQPVKGHRIYLDPKAFFQKEENIFPNLIQLVTTGKLDKFLFV